MLSKFEDKNNEVNGNRATIINIFLFPLIFITIALWFYNYLIFHNFSLSESILTPSSWGPAIIWILAFHLQLSRYVLAGIAIAVLPKIVFTVFKSLNNFSSLYKIQKIIRLAIIFLSIFIFIYSFLPLSDKSNFNLDKIAPKFFSTKELLTLPKSSFARSNVFGVKTNLNSGVVSTTTDLGGIFTNNQLPTCNLFIQDNSQRDKLVFNWAGDQFELSVNKLHNVSTNKTINLSQGRENDISWMSTSVMPYKSKKSNYLFILKNFLVGYPSVLLVYEYPNKLIYKELIPDFYLASGHGIENLLGAGIREVDGETLVALKYYDYPEDIHYFKGALPNKDFLLCEPGKEKLPINEFDHLGTRMFYKISD